MSWRRHMLLPGMLGGWLLAAALAGDAPAPRMAMSNYQIRELDERGELAWTMRGEKAVVAGRWVEFTRLDGTLAQSDGKDYRVATPAGTLDRETRILSSPEPVRVTREGMTIDGVGYDLDLANKVLSIRSEVRIILAARSLEALGKTPKTE